MSRYFFRKAINAIPSISLPDQKTNRDNISICFLLNGLDEDKLFKTRKYIEETFSYLPQISFLILGHQIVEDVATHLCIYSEKEIDWKGIPKSESVDRFLEKKWDLFFTLSTDYRPDFEYLTKSAQARYKIGYLLPEAYYDLDIALQAEENSNHSLFLKEVITYCPDLIHYDK